MLTKDVASAAHTPRNYKLKSQGVFLTISIASQDI